MTILNYVCCILTVFNMHSVIYIAKLLDIFFLNGLYFLQSFTIIVFIFLFVTYIYTLCMTK